MIKIRLSNQEWAPYMGKNLASYGIFSKLVLEAFARENVQVSYEFYPNNRTLEVARKGILDGSFGWAISAERQLDLLYTDPVLSANMVFFERVGAKKKWEKLSDLKKSRIGITLGNFYSEEFAQLQKQHVLITDTGTDDITGFRKLLAGHIDLFPIDVEVGQYLLQQNFPADKRAQITWQKQAFWIAPMHVVIWNKHPRAEELIARFNLGLKKMKDTGDFQKILDETRKQINQEK
ncbi:MULTISPECIES: ABC transporter substrate-binding protein [unclassified Iodobacter]|uniref:substrate-binding periplasmic protein n=1 Tax=unclassified Iodobacter TaxID=235634 RepID=UPI0025EE20AA|nr:MULTISPECIES: transporter substrate-binding domain-containing protein [unclassified Iodobacter]MDW5415204.1 transporter substrate-binding domain-containing protein [Iodobacter sp. CM08]